MGEVLAKEPDNVEAQYALAVAQRHQHQWTTALATLTGILERKPNFGRAHQEVGYNYLALQNFSRAGAAFERAITGDPSLINSWRCLARLYQDSGNMERLTAVKDQLAFLEVLPPELLSVISYLSENRLADAERLCKHFLQSNRTHVEGMRLLAEVATRNRTFDEAEFLLESCVEFHPTHRDARIQYANILMRMQKFAKAFEQAERLLAEHPNDNNHIRALYAAACAGVGRNADAIDGYQRLMKGHPDNHFFPVSLAHVHKADGEIEKAVALYRDAYRIKPDHGDAFWSLANTKSYEFTDDELARMESLATDPATGENDRIQVCFALGDAYESKCEYERSFGYYSRGNALKQPDDLSRPQAPASADRQSDRSLHGRTLRPSSRPGIRCARPDLRGWAAPIRIDPDRADPVVPLGRGRDNGIAQHSESRQAAARPGRA